MDRDEAHADTDADADRRSTGIVRRFVISCFLALIAEWGALIGVLVYAFERSGPRAAGFASLISLAPYLLLSSSTARLAQHHRPATVWTLSLVAQGFGYGAAGACALLHGSLVVVVAGAALGFTATTAMRPAGAVVLPALVRSTRELTTANVRIGQSDSVSVMLGPLVATGLLSVRGGGMVLIGCAAWSTLAAALVALDTHDGPPTGQPEQVEGAAEATRPSIVRRSLRVLARPFEDVRAVSHRPGVRAVLAVLVGQYLMVGAFDIISVVVAGEHLDLGRSGAGVLTTVFGAGAVLSTFVAGRTVRRRRLATSMITGLAVIAVACAVYGSVVTLVTACIVLPVVGCSRALLDLMGRVLLQRSAPPSELAAVFGAIETASGIGLLLGSALAQVLIGLSGATAALFGVAAVCGALALALPRSLRTADDHADVPVVAMSLLRQLPVFAPLPTFALEAVARSLEEITVPAGEVVIHQGDSGDVFYAVTDGAFDVVMTGTFVRTARRGDSFGEVALLADVPRTATVTAMQPGGLLGVERTPFLLAVTGHDSSNRAAWRAVDAMGLDIDLPNPLKQVDQVDQVDPPL
jgi:MFS family permease